MKDNIKKDYWGRISTVKSIKENFFEWPVKKGDRIVHLCDNGVMIELWNDQFSFDYTIKLCKNPKRKDVKSVNRKLQTKNEKEFKHILIS